VITASQPVADELPIAMTSRTGPIGFAELYELHYETVYRAALRVTGSPADAEDVLQSVFLRALSRVEEVVAASTPSAYLRRAAVNAAVDLLRRRAVRAEAEFDDRAPHAAVPPPTLLKERLRRAIATLDGDDATLFLLRHVEGLSLEELADMLQLTKNAVAVRLHRIRARLQDEMSR
jgi:RNA polymerase sigma-70 factor, ECF subfamily